MKDRNSQALRAVALALLALYLLSGRRWSDEGRLRRWLKELP